MSTPPPFSLPQGHGHSRNCLSFSQAEEVVERFKAAAAKYEVTEGKLQRDLANMENVEQRSAEWLAMREDRLTASSYGNVLG